MKFIFLDIDGVLNNAKSRRETFAPTILDDKNLKNLQTIVDNTGAKIILISSHKDGWTGVGDKRQSEAAKYIDKKFADFNVKVFGKTETSGAFTRRGADVKEYLKENAAESFVVIDDSASDYAAEGLADNWVRPCGEDGGLTKALAKKAIKILNG